MSTRKKSNVLSKKGKHLCRQQFFEFTLKFLKENPFFVEYAVWIFADKLETLKLKSVWRACKSLTLVPIWILHCRKQRLMQLSAQYFDLAKWIRLQTYRFVYSYTFEPCFKHVQQVTFKLSSVFKCLKGGCTIYATTVILRWRLFLPLSCQTNNYYNNSVSLGARNSSNGFCQLTCTCIPVSSIFFLHVRHLNADFLGYLCDFAKLFALPATKKKEQNKQTMLFSGELKSFSQFI